MPKKSHFTKNVIVNKDIVLCFEETVSSMNWAEEGSCFDILHALEIQDT